MTRNTAVVESLETPTGQHSAPDSSSLEPGALPVQAWVVTVVEGIEVTVMLAATQEIAERLAITRIDPERWDRSPGGRVGPLETIDPPFALDYWWGAVDVMSSPECLIRGEHDSMCTIERQQVITS